MHAPEIYFISRDLNRSFCFMAHNIELRYTHFNGKNMARSVAIALDQLGTISIQEAVLLPYSGFSECTFLEQYQFLWRLPR